VLGRIGGGWALLESLVEPDVAAVTRGLLADPRPLCDALARYPWTLAHGDMKVANLGIQRGSPARVVLLDWHFAGSRPPSADLAWFIDTFSAILPVTREATIQCYRRCLARRLGDRFDEGWWQPQLELGLLGGFLRQAWFSLYDGVHANTEAERARARSNLAWWSEQVRDGVRWL
jgi:hypothetical protein